jgi:hypothetical protein
VNLLDTPNIAVFFRIVNKKSRNYFRLTEAGFAKNQNEANGTAAVRLARKTLRFRKVSVY